MMAPAARDTLDPEVERSYLAAIRRHTPNAPAPVRLDHFAFYERARGAFGVVVTGELAKYGNIVLKKGVIGG
jgi:L-fucose mutarotase